MQELVAPERTLELVSSLCRALEEAEIHYCHWKSNESLDRSASGENDLDLLVSRAEAPSWADAAVIPARIGTKPLFSRGSKRRRPQLRLATR